LKFENQWFEQVSHNSLYNSEIINLYLFVLIREN